MTSAFRLGDGAHNPWKKRTSHFTWKVLNQPGISEIAQQRFEWNPSDQTLSVHGIWKTRDGKRLSA